MSRRLLLALLVSLLLHGGMFYPQWRVPVPPPGDFLEASLRIPERAPPIADQTPLLKNTLPDEKGAAAVKPAPPRPPVSRPSEPPRTEKRAVEAAQRKLSQHLYYPPDAVSRGIEGEVRLLLTLADDGSIVEVSVAASSGHLILDRAAVRAAWAIGRVNWASSRELILPVVFRLD